MKKFLTIILALGLALTYGCSKSSDSIKGDTGVSNSNKTVSTSNGSSTIYSEPIVNSFFFQGNVTQQKYKASFDGAKEDVMLHINEVANLKNGKLYELKLDSIEGFKSNRLNLGYFYVQKDRIYKIEPTEENLNKLKTSDELPEGSVTVCADKEIKDTLKENEKGFHHNIVVNGNKREYHSYNNQVETGFYESFTWDENIGLINYRSGFGAGRDELELSNN